MDRSFTLARRDVLKGAGLLLVSLGAPNFAVAAETVAGGWPKTIPMDAVDTFIAIGADGRVTAFSGRVEIGTGVQTAMGQIVADELDVAFDRVTMVMGDTDRTPAQGRTSASVTIQKEAIPLRSAAAEAYHFLLSRAAERLGVPVADLKVENGIVISKRDSAKRVSYGELIGDKRFDLRLPGTAKVKRPADYKVVGKRIARVDIPAKVTAGLVFVHDVRRPGMVHARVVRPPYTGIETPLGTSLVSVDESSVSHIPGLVKVVTIGDFVAVVTEREENAIRAARALKVTWKPWAGLPDFVQLEKAIREHPSKSRTYRKEGDVDAAIAGLSKPIKATYLWPYHLHGSIGPSCAVAEIADGRLTIWSATRDPGALRRDAAELLKMPEESVRIVWLEGSGSYGRNCTDDATLDAALLTREIGRPVRVQVMRDEEHGWEPKGAAQLIDIHGGVDANGKIVAYDVTTKFMGGTEAESMTPYMTRQKPPSPKARTTGDRNAAPPYGIENLRVTVLDLVPPVRTSLLRGVASLPNSFAHEAFMDEMALVAGVDPVEFRLRNLADPRAIALVKATTEKAGWQPRATRKTQSGNIVTGRGVAYAQYAHSENGAVVGAYTAWVAEVEADLATGRIRITRVVVGQDCGLMINPLGCEQQIRGNVIQAVSRIMREEVTFNQSAVTTRDWANYPIATFLDIPEIDIVLIDRPEEPPIGVGESAIVPSAGAIANAIFDATGLRLRQVPFTPDRVKAALNQAASTKIN
jgi:nicotinate dehydrogenase subunit B